jgi:hypothetical protein
MTGPEFKASLRALGISQRAFLMPRDFIDNIALSIERGMFAPHELPLSEELHAKYLQVAKSVARNLLKTVSKPNSAVRLSDINRACAYLDSIVGTSNPEQHAAMWFAEARAEGERNSRE